MSAATSPGTGLAYGLRRVCAACVTDINLQPPRGIGFREARFSEITAMREYRACRDEAVELDRQARHGTKLTINGSWRPWLRSGTGPRYTLTNAPSRRAGVLIWGIVAVIAAALGCMPASGAAAQGTVIIGGDGEPNVEVDLGVIGALGTPPGALGMRPWLSHIESRNPTATSRLLAPAESNLTVRTTLALHRQTARQWVGRHYRDGDNMTIAYTDEIGIAICTRIIEGLTIKEICADPDLPSERTVYRWLAAEPSFWRLYVRAPHKLRRHADVRDPLARLSHAPGRRFVCSPAAEDGHSRSLPHRRC